ADTDDYPPGMVRRARPVILALGVLAFAACSSNSSAPDHPLSPSARRKVRTELTIRPAGFPLPSALQREVALELDGAVYLVGGLNNASTTLADVVRLDPDTGATTPVGTLAAPVHDAAGAVIGGKLIIFAGGQGVGTTTVQSFDPATGASAVIGHLPVALSDLSSAVVDGTVYLVGGYDGHLPRKEIYATTNGHSFTKVADLPTGLRYPAVTVVGSSVIIAGGVSANGPTNVVYAFDPAAATVRPIAHLAAAIGHAAAFTLGSKAYVVGGLNAADSAVTSVTVIDPATGISHRLPPLGQPVTDAGVVSVGDRVFIIGGARAISISTSVPAVLAATTRRAPIGSPSP
ncbi:MAG: hypothetical protein QOI81_245, partial [Actinomycetota bacterium]|nr:hypothetical protein [Actinomycetota bacterium]